MIGEQGLELNAWAQRAFVELVGNLREGLEDAQASAEGVREVNDGLLGKVKDLEAKVALAEEWTGKACLDATNMHGRLAETRKLLEDAAAAIESILARRDRSKIACSQVAADELRCLVKKLQAGAAS